MVLHLLVLLTGSCLRADMRWHWVFSRGDLSILPRHDENLHVDWTLPFELRALEGALHMAVEVLVADTLHVEGCMLPSLERLSHQVRLPFPFYTPPLPGAGRPPSASCCQTCVCRICTCTAY